MKQIIQDLKKGDTILEEVPVPRVKSGSVLIQTTRTLVSLGTERMLVDFGKANFIQKAKQQPDKVKMVLDKVKTDGLRPTLEAVFNKLGQPLPLGYCNVGRVCDSNLQDYPVGMRVVSNGYHAEVVSAAKNLMAQIRVLSSRREEIVGQGSGIVGVVQHRSHEATKHLARCYLNVWSKVRFY